MSTQEYSISTNRSRPDIPSSPDLSSRNSPKRRPFFVPPDLAELGLSSVHPYPLVMDEEKRPRGRRPAPIAWAQYPRLEVNPPNAYSVITLDVDDVHNLPDKGWRYGKPALPPTWVVQSLETGKMHLGYILETPVHRNPESLKGPLKKLTDVTDRLTHHLGGDPGYGGLITRNPLAPGPDTHVYWQSFLPYTLTQLDKRLPRAKRRRGEQLEPTGIRRNVTTFEELYKQGFKPRWHRLIEAEGWDGAWLEHVREYNVTRNDPPLPDVECRSIAKSCARYSLRDYVQAAVDARQRRKNGKKWHDKYDYDFDTRNANILALDGMGFRQREIAEVVDISRRRVGQILQELARNGEPEFWEPYT